MEIRPKATRDELADRYYKYNYTKSEKEKV
jgi:hypothetical protein